MKDYQEISAEMKLTAAKILNEKNVLAILEKYGKVTITGSYAYDLMYNPDIDIVIECNNPEETSYMIIKEFIELKSFQKYQLGDFKNYPREHRPKSFIVVLILEIGRKRWEIEIWFHKNYPEEKTARDKQMQSISEKEKNTIIRLKHEREINGLGKSLESISIYDGVMVDGKREIDEFF